MPSCEKCWRDAYLRALSDPNKSQAEHYEDLLEERKENPCSQEQQVVKYWDRIFKIILER